MFQIDSDYSYYLQGRRKLSKIRAGMHQKSIAWGTFSSPNLQSFLDSQAPPSFPPVLYLITAKLDLV
jgi:hypothetical protein